MFDAIAPRYDLLNRVLSGGLDVRWRTRAIRSLALRGGETVLDLCTGTADLAIASATASPGAGSVVGVDFSGQMLRLGQAKLMQRGLASRIRLVQGDAMRIPLAACSVDAATVAFGIRNVQEPQAAFADVFRVLRPGGRFAILEFGVPRLPVVRQAYLAYFRHVLPRIGCADLRPLLRLHVSPGVGRVVPEAGGDHGSARRHRIFTGESRLSEPSASSTCTAPRSQTSADLPSSACRASQSDARML